MKKNCFPTKCNPCKPMDPKCGIGSDQIYWTGGDIPYIGVLNGEALNNVIWKVVESVKKIGDENSPVYKETFIDNGNNIRLKNVPSEILEIVYCSFTLTEAEYTRSGRDITFSDAFCRTEGSEIRVIYKGAFSNALSRLCDELGQV